MSYGKTRQPVMISPFRLLERSQIFTDCIQLLTLHESSELVRNAFQAGVNGYLLKTDAEQELVRALHEVLERGNYVSPRIDASVAREVNANTGARISGNGDAGARAGN